jgi:cysteine desulfurase
VRALRADLVAGVRAVVPDAALHGVLAADSSLPGVTNLGFPGASADAMVMMLDAAGIDCSSGSACSAGLSQGSHVLVAMGLTEATARSSIRFSLGHSSTAADVAALLAALPEAVQRARAAAAFA